MESRRLGRIFLIHAFVGLMLSVYAGVPDVQSTLDPVNRDFRLSLSSPLVDAGTGYADIGRFQTDLSITLAEFLNARLVLATGETLCVVDGQISVNTFSSDVVVVEHIAPTVELAVRQAFTAAAVCSLSVWPTQADSIPQSLSAMYPVVSVKYNYAPVTEVTMSQLDPTDTTRLGFLVDRTAPAKVTGVVSVETGQGVQLSWSPNTESDLARYKVYRIPRDQPSLATQIASVQGMAYLDSYGSLLTHTYKIVAYDRYGNESESIYSIYWEHSKHIFLNTTGSGADVADTVYAFPVLVRLTDEVFDFATASPTGDDIRFASRSGSVLPYQIERWDTLSHVADVWVLVDTVNGNDSSQYFDMFWGHPSMASQSAPPTVFDTSIGFSGVWHLSEAQAGVGTADLYQDASYRRLHGVDSSAAIGKSGVIGLGQQFDKEQADFIALPASTDTTASLTLSAWVYLDTIYPSWDTANAKRENYIFGNWCSWPPAGFELSLLSDQLVAILNVNGPQHWYYQESVVTAPRTWVHVAVTWDSSGSLKFYRNGTCVSEQSTPAGAIISTDVVPYRISTNSTNRALDGNADEVRFERVRRESAWLKLCYENQKTGQTLIHMEPLLSPELLAYEGFDYTTDVPLHNLNGGLGDWGGPWQNVRSVEWHKALVASPGATYATLTESGNCVVVDNTTTHQYRPLAGSVGGTPDTVWIGCVMGEDDYGDNGSWAAIAPICGTYGYNTDPTNIDNRLFSVQVDGQGSARAFRFKKHFANGTWVSPGLDSYGWGQVPWTPGDHFVLIMLVIAQPSSYARAWIDPTDVDNLPPAPIGIDGNANGLVSFDGIQWYVEPFHQNRTARLDELRIGTSAAAVSPGL